MGSYLPHLFAGKVFIVNPFKRIGSCESGVWQGVCNAMLRVFAPKSRDTSAMGEELAEVKHE